MFFLNSFQVELDLLNFFWKEAELRYIQQKLVQEIMGFEFKSQPKGLEEYR